MQNTLVNNVLCRHHRHDESPLPLDGTPSPLPVHKHKRSKHREGSPVQEYR